MIERFAYRPLRDAPRLAPADQRARRLVLPPEQRAAPVRLPVPELRLVRPRLENPELFEPGPLIDPVFVVTDVNIQLIQLIVLSRPCRADGRADLLVARTRLGKAMRATSYDREAAAMMGIDADRVIASTFFIGSVLAGAAGVMFGLLFSQVFHFMGFLAGLKGFTAAVVGGIGSIPGAMLGGLLVGLAEAFAPATSAAAGPDLTVFGILILVLLIRPSGLLGTRAIQKV